MQTTKRILLVDDDVDDQFLFCEALKELHSHIDCVIANDGAEALRLIEEIPELDVIFLDLNMPRVDGFECLIHSYQGQPFAQTYPCNHIKHYEPCGRC